MYYFENQGKQTAIYSLFNEYATQEGIVSEGRMWGWGDFHTVHNMYLLGKSPGLKYNPQYFYVNAAKHGGGVGWAVVSLRHLGLQEANLISVSPLAVRKRLQSPWLFPWGPVCKSVCFCLGLQRKWAGRHKRSQTGDLNNFISQYYDPTHITLSSPSTFFWLLSSVLHCHM